MKKENIIVGMETEKVKAIRRYMEKKEVTVEEELTDALVKLYEKYVPSQVREYIDESENEIKAQGKSKKQKANAKASSAENTTNNHDLQPNTADTN